MMAHFLSSKPPFLARYAQKQWFGRQSGKRTAKIWDPLKVLIPFLVTTVLTPGCNAARVPQRFFLGQKNLKPLFWAPKTGNSIGDPFFRQKNQKFPTDKKSGLGLNVVNAAGLWTGSFLFLPRGSCRSQIPVPLILTSFPPCSLALEPWEFLTCVRYSMNEATTYFAG